MIRGIPATGQTLNRGVRPIYPPGCLRSPETVYCFNKFLSVNHTDNFISSNKSSIGGRCGYFSGNILQGKKVGGIRSRWLGVWNYFNLGGDLGVEARFTRHGSLGIYADKTGNFHFQAVSEPVAAVNRGVPSAQEENLPTSLPHFSRSGCSAARHSLPARAQRDDCGARSYTIAPCPSTRFIWETSELIQPRDTTGSDLNWCQSRRRIRLEFGLRSRCPPSFPSPDWCRVPIGKPSKESSSS